MEIHGDVQQRAVVDSTALPWSRWGAGVERKVFEMRADGAATMLVRLHAGATLAPLDHAGCEDAWILEGDLDAGLPRAPSPKLAQEFARPRWGEGERILRLGNAFDSGHPVSLFAELTFRDTSFVHEPPGSRRARTSSRGATFLLKLRPADARDRQRVIAGHGPRAPHHRSGVMQTPLHACGEVTIVLLHFAANTSIAAHRHDDGEEFFVLAGSLRDQHGGYAVGSWVRQPCGSVHSVVSEHGCTLFSIAGHLRGR